MDIVKIFSLRLLPIILKNFTDSQSLYYKLEMGNELIDEEMRIPRNPAKNINYLKFKI